MRAKKRRESVQYRSLRPQTIRQIQEVFTRIPRERLEKARDTLLYDATILSHKFYEKIWGTEKFCFLALLSPYFEKSLTMDERVRAIHLWCERLRGPEPLNIEKLLIARAQEGRDQYTMLLSVNELKTLENLFNERINYLIEKERLGALANGRNSDNNQHRVEQKR